MNKYAVFWINNNGEQDSQNVEGVKERNNLLNELKNNNEIVYVFYEKMIGKDDRSECKVVKDTVIIDSREKAYRFMTTCYPHVNAKKWF